MIHTTEGGVINIRELRQTTTAKSPNNSINEHNETARAKCNSAKQQREIKNFQSFGEKILVRRQSFFEECGDK